VTAGLRHHCDNRRPDLLGRRVMPGAGVPTGARVVETKYVGRQAVQPRGCWPADQIRELW